MIATRKFRSSPYRDSSETWAAIANLLTRLQPGAQRELQLVSGVISSCIADQAVKGSPIEVTCGENKVRIFCLYDDEALDESDSMENSLGFDPLSGDWKISIPCTKDDLLWVQASLKKQTGRITARDLSVTIAEDKSTASSTSELTINLEGFLGK